MIYDMHKKSTIKTTIFIDSRKDSRTAGKQPEGTCLLPNFQNCPTLRCLQQCRNFSCTFQGLRDPRASKIGQRQVFTCNISNSLLCHTFGLQGCAVKIVHYFRSSKGFDARCHGYPGPHYFTGIPVINNTSEQNQGKRPYCDTVQVPR